jgi:hypothetical protein
VNSLDRIQPAERTVRVHGDDPSLTTELNPAGSFEYVIGFRADIGAAANIERMAAEAALTGINLGAAPTKTLADLAYCFHLAYHEARDRSPQFSRARFAGFLGYALAEIAGVVTDLNDVLKVDDESEPGEAPDPRGAEPATASE